MGNCPPGVFCITHGSLLLAIAIACYALYLYSVEAQRTTLSIAEIGERPPTVVVATNRYPGPSADPAVPPLRHPSFNYGQQGILKSTSDSSRLLPLMGRTLRPSRDTWSYYTYQDGNNLMKLPILHKKKNCTGEYGCDRIFTGDTVLVEGLDEAFTAIVYENAAFSYTPF